MGFSSSWSQEDSDLAVKLWHEGLSARAIAERLGNRYTRNAVVGRMHRLGLSNMRPKTIVRTYKRKAKPAQRPPVHNALGNPIRIPVDPTPLPIPPASDVARVKFVDLEPHHCRWPIGDTMSADFGYCGERKMIGLSYCAGHQARAMIPLKPHENKRQRATEEAARLRQNQKEKVEA